MRLVSRGVAHSHVGRKHGYARQNIYTRLPFEFGNFENRVVEHRPTAVKVRPNMGEKSHKNFGGQCSSSGSGLSKTIGGFAPYDTLDANALG
jgi:hypothetical protein